MLVAMTTYLCPQDGTRADTTSLTWRCPECGGPWDLDFRISEPLSPNSLAGRVNSLWRYEEVLPLSAPATTLGEGRTPLVPLTDTVSAKLDFLMPTLSFKDRGAVMLAELARRLNPDRVVADSSGNAGTAVAAYCARAGLPCTVYVPEGTSPKKTEQIRAHGAQLHIVPGDREATALAARSAADAPGTFYASHVFNPYFLHGTKTYVYEMWEDLGGQLPDAIAVPVGNGTLLLGAALATRELLAQGLIERRPALIAVQAEAVAPLAAAFRAGADDLLDGAGDGPAAPTLAEGIAIPRPPRARQILAAVRASGGTFLTVPEDRIRSAQLDLAARGLYVETTGVACWAAVGDWTDRSVVVPLCGAGLKTGPAS
ncbi:pyridoxal-phosphate dependent enzyme [Streptomyces finlayi]|uniref:Pyridoxal-phosphate dependent enzyme n=2 Tax=Streptomyces finlayi TaxID=67296 RepID=A0A7G7BV26_9ACTN|nr:pyridoxal-phosphate dependent enzyme [Streptomyces finlayi]